MFFPLSGRAPASTGVNAQTNARPSKRNTNRCFTVLPPEPLVQKRIPCAGRSLAEVAGQGYAFEESPAPNFMNSIGVREGLGGRMNKLPLPEARG